MGGLRAHTNHSHLTYLGFLVPRATQARRFGPMVSELRESYASIDHQFIISAVLVRYCSYTSVLAFTV